jgi:3',5'-cyclic-AMP phosphodiesterase
MPPFHFLHLTDPHVPPEGELLYGQDPSPRLQAAIDDILARHGPAGPAPAAFAVVTGDLVRDGEPAAYARLRGMLARLPCPSHLLLGNHDDRDAFRAAFPAAPTDPAGFVQQALPTPIGLFVLLDTLVQGEAFGRLCPARLAWLAATLAGSAGPVVLCLHHPPFPIGLPAMDAIALRDPDALWAVLAPHASRIRHLCHGHLHRPIAGAWRGISVSSLSGTAFRVPLTFAEEAVRPRGREAPSYGIVRVTDDAVVAHIREVAVGPAAVA